MNLNEALFTNTRLQLGCYISGQVALEPDVDYVYSEWADDNVWNRAAVVGRAPTAHLLGLIAASAEARGRAPVVAVDREFSWPREYRPTATEPERWMRCSPRSLNRAAVPAGVTISSINAARPEDGFLRVFANLFGDPSTNALFDRYYVPALRNAVKLEADPWHFVAWLDGEPVGCASLYLIGASAGLYNVGTRHDRQKRGLGRALSFHATRHAFERGAAGVVLQCVAGSHVERMYEQLGFVDTATLTIATFSQSS